MSGDPYWAVRGDTNSSGWGETVLVLVFVVGPMLLFAGNVIALTVSYLLDWF